MSGRFGRMALDASLMGSRGKECPRCKGEGEIKSPRRDGEMLTCPKCGGTGEVRKTREEMATDPPVSEAQRRAMFAAKSGHSKLGIPKSVGEEFAEADPGGKL